MGEKDVFWKRATVARRKKKWRAEDNNKSNRSYMELKWIVSHFKYLFEMIISPRIQFFIFFGSDTRIHIHDRPHLFSLRYICTHDYVYLFNEVNTT